MCGCLVPIKQLERLNHKEAIKDRTIGGKLPEHGRHDAGFVEWIDVDPTDQDWRRYLAALKRQLEHIKI